MKHWTYKTVFVETTKKRMEEMAQLDDALNEYGKDGWECVQFYWENIGKGFKDMCGFKVLLKRPYTEDTLR